MAKKIKPRKLRKSRVLPSIQRENKKEAQIVPNIKNATSLVEKYILELKNKFKESICFQGLYGLFIPIFAIIMSMTSTAWPMNNVILCPEYWYEPLFPVIISFMTATSANILIQTSMGMKIDLILSWKAFLKVFFANTLGFVFPYVSVYFIWGYILKYPHPMPFIGKASLAISYLVYLPCFWFLLPSNLRKDDKYFRTRLLTYMIIFPLNILMSMGYSSVSSLFSVVPSEMEWCMGVFLPIVKKFNIFIFTKIANKAAGGEQISASLALTIHVQCAHSFCLALLLGSIISPNTAYVLMIFDCVPNIFSFIKIIKLNNNLSRITREKLYEELQDLILGEFIEVMVPVIYCVSLVVAYYGPNSKILGNIGNDYWDYRKIENIHEVLSSIATLFAIDVAQGIVFVTVFRRVCRLDIFKTYIHVMRKYGTLVMFNMTTYLTMVMGYY